MVTTYFGYICPNCKSTVDIGAIATGTDTDTEILCSQCHTPMVPNPNGRIVSTNVKCLDCNISFGMINSDKCPQCGKTFTQ
jgi:DNA-directed RNA polymerase subunit RPC12/RpoP